MKTFVFTPPHETGIIVVHIVLCAGSHDTRLGRESSWRKAPFGTHFFRPLMVKWAFGALTGRAAFLFRRKSKSLFRPAPWPHAAAGPSSLAAMAATPAPSSRLPQWRPARLRAAWTGRAASVRVASQRFPRARASGRPVSGGEFQTGFQRHKGVRHLS